MLYAIQVGGEGPVKLGFTTRDPVARLKDLQTSHHEQLHLRAAWDGDAADERRLHRCFAGVRLKGEWFTYTAELQAFVEACMSGVAPALSEVAAVTGRRDPPRSRAGSLTPGPDANAPRRSLDRPVRRPEECVAALCELVPWLAAPQLLAWLTLVEHAGPGCEACVELATIADRALGRRDLRAAALLLRALYELDASDPLARVPRRPASRLICGIKAEIPPYLRGRPTETVCPVTRRPRQIYTLLDGMLANGRAYVELASPHVAAFGPAGVPESFAALTSFAERHAWATQQLAAAEQRVNAQRPSADAA
ncbi:MAG TPA: GIY-YIG nuclease family protein [Solirubrobacteraceae bacterium]|jgi:hypothetical protein|nr:GIY-YIG nuclease family protein [Solirubrobacteraceae bacterium]